MATKAELKENATKRPKCFTCCNTGEPTCIKSESDHCPAYLDCLLITPVINKGYDPRQPESGTNQITSNYNGMSLEDKMKIEEIIVSEKAKAAAPAASARSREREPEQTKKTRGRPKATPAVETPVETPAKPAANPMESIDSALSQLDQAAVSAEPTNEVPVEAEQLDHAIDKVVSPSMPVPTAPVSSGTELIDYAVDLFMNKLEIVLKACLGKQIAHAELRDPDEEVPAEEKRGRKAGAKRGPKAGKRGRKAKK